MRFSLKEDQVNIYCKTFQDYIDGIQCSNNVLYASLNSIMTESEYLQFQELIHGVLEEYSHILFEDIKRGSFNTWVESAKSLNFYVQTMLCGDAAVNRAKRIECKLQEILTTTIKIDIGQFKAGDKPLIKTEEFIEFRNTITRFQNSISDMSINERNKLSILADDNHIFGTLVSLIDIIEANIYEFCNFALKAVAKLQDKVDDISNKRDDTVRSKTGRNSGTSHKAGKDVGVADGVATGTIGAESIAASTKIGSKSKKSSAKNIKDNLSENNLSALVCVLENMVNEVGVDQLNKAIETYGDSIIHVTSGSNTGDNSVARQEEPDGAENKYGRYYVTKETISVMDNEVYRVHQQMKTADSYYKKRLKSAEDGALMNAVQTMLTGTSNIFSKLAIEPYDITADFKAQAESKTLSLLTYSLTLSPEFIGAAMISSGAVNALNEAMPKIKESKVLSKIKSKFWDSSRKRMEVPPVDGYIAMYMYEHYQKKLYPEFIDSGCYTVMHAAIENVDSKHRRWLEDCCMASNIYFCSKYGGMTGQFRYDSNRSGALLNLVRAGLVGRPNITIAIGNELTDVVYDAFVEINAFKPNTLLNPLTGKSVEI